MIGRRGGIYRLRGLGRGEIQVGMASATQYDTTNFDRHPLLRITLRPYSPTHPYHRNLNPWAKPLPSSPSRHTMSIRLLTPTTFAHPQPVHLGSTDIFPATPPNTSQINSNQIEAEGRNSHFIPPESAGTMVDRETTGRPRGRGRGEKS